MRPFFTTTRSSSLDSDRASLQVVPTQLAVTNETVETRHTPRNLIMPFLSRVLCLSTVVLGLLLTSMAQGQDRSVEPSTRLLGPGEQIVHAECEGFLQQMVSEEHFSGVAIVVQEDKVRHAKGYGDANADQQNGVETVFHVASITKQFTAVAILQLVAEGKIALQKPINDYLPEKYRSVHWNEVNVAHLLSHSSGIPDYAVVRDYYEVVEGFCLGETVDGMIREAMSKEPRIRAGFEVSLFEYWFHASRRDHRESDIDAV